MTVAAAAAAAYPVFAKAIYDRGRFPGGEMSVTPGLVLGAFAGAAWDRAAANALFLIATVAGVFYLTRRFGRFIGFGAASLVVLPVFLPVAVVRLTTQFWHPRFSYFALPAVVGVGAFGFVAIAGALASASGRRTAAAALAVVLALGAAKAVGDNVGALRISYVGERQDFRDAVALVNRNRDWWSASLVWPFRNWDCYHFYTKTIGGPAALAVPRTKVYQYFDEAPRIFMVSTDADFDDELVARYPNMVRFRFARVAVLYYDPAYKTAGDAYRRLPRDVVAAPPGVVDNALGRLALHAGDETRAFRYFEAGAREAGAENPDLFFLTDIYVERGQYRKALGIIGEYVRRHPDEAWPYTKLANVYLKLGARNAAAACYRRALWLDPDKKAWRERLKELVTKRKPVAALIGYCDPRWF